MLQYTKGPACDLVKGCQYLPGAEGYIKARNLFKNTFGQKFQIAKANIDSVVNGSVLDIKDKLSLIAFSAKLNACMNVLEGMNYLNRIENLDILHKITKCLPPSWFTEWQCEADHVIHAKLREVSIKDLASYVSLRTRQQTNFACHWNRTPKTLARKHFHSTPFSICDLSIQKRGCQVWQGCSRDSAQLVQTGV